MVITKLNQLYSLIQESTTKTLIAVWANDLHSIEALSKAVDLKIIQAILIGVKEIIEYQCINSNIDSHKFKIIDVNNEISAATIAVDLIRQDKGDIIMKGLISTDKFMKAILNKEAGLVSPKGLLNNVVVIENEYYHKLLIAGDVAIIPNPDLNKKIGIAQALIHTAQSMGIKRPKLALISASEQIIPSLSSSIEAHKITENSVEYGLGQADVFGPISLDGAINAEAAQIKGIKNIVAGDADCLLFPNIDAGNVFYKMNTKMSESKNAAFVSGARVPIVLSSRGDTMETKLNSIALCVALSSNKNI